MEIDNMTNAEELETLKKSSDVMVRNVSRRLDEINSHINAIDFSLSYSSCKKVFQTVWYMVDVYKRGLWNGEKDYKTILW